MDFRTFGAKIWFSGGFVRTYGFRDVLYENMDGCPRGKGVLLLFGSYYCEQPKDISYRLPPPPPQNIRQHNFGPESGQFLILKPQNVSKFRVWISYFERPPELATEADRFFSLKSLLLASGRALKVSF